jgi:CRP/FNR family transcriptional regulator
LLSFGASRRWARRETIFRAGEPAGSFFKIVRGFVALTRMIDDGRRQIVSIHTTGDLCGYLDNNGLYQFGGEALTDVEACGIDRRKFDVFASHNPDLASALFADLAEKLSRAKENMAVIGQLRSTERVAHFLVEVDRLYAERRVAVQPLALHLTRQEIADYLGLTLETVSRSFAKLKQQHLIALVGGDAVVILDHKKLAALAKVA